MLPDEKEAYQRSAEKQILSLSVGINGGIRILNVCSAGLYMNVGFWHKADTQFD